MRITLGICKGAAVHKNTTAVIGCRVAVNVQRSGTGKITIDKENTAAVAARRIPPDGRRFVARKCTAIHVHTATVDRSLIVGNRKALGDIQNDGVDPTV